MTSLVHVPRRHAHEWRLVLKVAFWLMAAAWVIVAVLAPRAAAGSTFPPASPVIGATEGPRLVWPQHESWRPHFYE